MSAGQSAGQTSCGVIEWAEDEFCFTVTESRSADSVQFRFHAEHSEREPGDSKEKIQRKIGDDFYTENNGFALRIVEAELPVVSGVIVGKSYEISCT